MATFNFIKFDGTVLTSSFSVIPIYYPVVSGSSILSADVLTSSTAPASMSLVDNTYKAEYRDSRNQNIWYFQITSGSLTSLSASVIPVGLSTVYFDLKDFSSNPLAFRSITISPVNSCSYTSGSFVSKEGNDYTADSIGHYTASLLQQPYNVLLQSNVKKTQFQIQPSGSVCNAKDVIVTTQNVSPVINTYNSASLGFTTQVSDARYVLAGGFINSASFANTSSYSVNSTSASYAITASYSNNSASSSYANSANVSNNTTSASYATTASYSNNSTNAVNATVATVVSSSGAPSGINVHGSGEILLMTAGQITEKASGNFTMTGNSVNINAGAVSTVAVSNGDYSVATSFGNINLSPTNGTVNVNGVNGLAVNGTQSLNSSGFALVSLNSTSSISSSYATTSSFSLNAVPTVSASFASASISSSVSVSSSFANTSSLSRVANVVSNSIATGIYAASGDVVLTSVGNGVKINSNSDAIIASTTGNVNVNPASFANINLNGQVIASGLTGSLLGTSSVSLNSISSSYATTASYATNAVPTVSASWASASISSSFATTAINATSAVSASYVSAVGVTVKATTGTLNLSSSASNILLTAAGNATAPGIQIRNTNTIDGDILISAGVTGNGGNLNIYADGGQVNFSSSANATPIILNYGTNNFTFNQPITASAFLGTASWASNAVTASFINQAVNSLSAVSASWASKSLSSVSSSFASASISSSWTSLALSSSYSPFQYPDITDITNLITLSGSTAISSSATNGVVLYNPSVKNNSITLLNNSPRTSTGAGGFLLNYSGSIGNSSEIFADADEAYAQGQAIYICPSTAGGGGRVFIGRSGKQNVHLNLSYCNAMEGVPYSMLQNISTDGNYALNPASILGNSSGGDLVMLLGATQFITNGQISSWYNNASLQFKSYALSSSLSSSQYMASTPWCYNFDTYNDAIGLVTLPHTIWRRAGNLIMSLSPLGSLSVSSSVSSSQVIAKNHLLTGSYTTVITGSTSLSASHNGQFLIVAFPSQSFIAVPAGLPQGFTCTLFQSGSGQVCVTGSSVNIRNRASLSSSYGQYAAMSLLQLDSGNYLLQGDLG